VRALFLVLLLANVLFLAWTQWVVPPSTMPRSMTDPPVSSLQSIRLAREVAPTPAAPNETGANLEDLTAAPCVSVGPFATEPQAVLASASLERLGFMSRLRTANDEVRVGTWVRVPNLATAEDATNAVAALRAAGLPDVFVVSDGEPINTVSVGVYADPGKARDVAQTVSKSGLAPQLSDRRRTLDVFWLDIDRQANGSLPPLEVLGPFDDGTLPLEMRACPRIASPEP
jgi:hypothetical protein